MKNDIRDSLQNGDVVYGARVRTFSTTTIQILGETGVDYVYIDLEHAGFSPYNSTELEHRLMAAKQVDLELVVRIPSCNPDMIRKVLDAGVRTVLIPRIKRPAEVERAVKASKFQYDGTPGERGFGSSPSNNWGVRPDDYTDSEDEQVLIGIMLETESAVRNAEEILSVPELGFAKIGLGDLTVSLECPQEYENETVQDVVETFEQGCQNNSLPMGIGVSDSRAAKEAIDNGYRLIEIGGDAEVLRTTFTERMDGIQSHTT